MAQINKSSDYFNTKLYTGTGATHNITGVGFQPDLVWIKQRNGTRYHRLIDSVRGATKELYSNGTDSEIIVADGLTSFDSNGFTLGSGIASNGSGDTFVGWSWRGSDSSASSNTDGSITSNVSANTTSGFSICTYTGNGTSGATFGHGLNSAPEMVILKTRNTTGQWRVGATPIDSTFNEVMNLNLTNAKASASSIFNSTAPSSTVVTLGNEGDANGNNNTFVAYCFHSVKGFSKFGSYTGNGNADGTFVYTGFKPAWVVTKVTNTTGSWYMLDNKRDGYNVTTKWLDADSSDAENTTSSDLSVDFLSNGFKARTSNNSRNGSGDTYIYMAFAEQPLVGTNNIPATAR